MPDKFLSMLPFLVIDSGGGGKPKINTARLLEIVVMLAALWWGLNTAVTKLEIKMDSIERHVASLDERLYEHATKAVK